MCGKVLVPGCREAEVLFVNRLDASSVEWEEELGDLIAARNSWLL